MASRSATIAGMTSSCGRTTRSSRRRAARARRPARAPRCVAIAVLVDVERRRRVGRPGCRLLAATGASRFAARTYGSSGPGSTPVAAGSAGRCCGGCAAEQVVDHGAVHDVVRWRGHLADVADHRGVEPQAAKGRSAKACAGGFVPCWHRHAACVRAGLPAGTDGCSEAGVTAARRRSPERSDEPLSDALRLRDARPRRRRLPRPGRRSPASPALLDGARGRRHDAGLRHQQRGPAAGARSLSTSRRWESTRRDTDVVTSAQAAARSAGRPAARRVARCSSSAARVSRSPCASMACAGQSRRRDPPPWSRASIPMSAGRRSRSAYAWPDGAALGRLQHRPDRADRAGDRTGQRHAGERGRRGRRTAGPSGGGQAVPPAVRRDGAPDRRRAPARRRRPARHRHRGGDQLRCRLPLVMTGVTDVAPSVGGSRQRCDRRTSRWTLEGLGRAAPERRGVTDDRRGRRLDRRGRRRGASRSTSAAATATPGCGPWPPLPGLVRRHSQPDRRPAPASTSAGAPRRCRTSDARAAHATLETATEPRRRSRADDGSST